MFLVQTIGRKSFHVKRSFFFLVPEWVDYIRAKQWGLDEITLE